MLNIKVSALLSNDAALTPNAGDLLYNKIESHFKKKELVVLDFDGIRFITSAFLNASIGQLYGVFPQPFIKEHLTVENLENDDAFLLVKVVERAKEYFQDKKAIENASNNLSND
jgi:STAS-like domain of unknown function (DUF4325)